MPFPTLGDAPWQRVAVQDAMELYDNLDLRMAAAVIARSHPYGYQTLGQAPVLALVLDHAGLKPERQYKHPLLRQIGARLKDVLASLKLAPQLRSIHGKALRPGQLPLLQDLSKLPPSVLAQALPADTATQVEWLSALGAWRRHMESRGVLRSLLLDWAATTLSRSGSFQQWREVADLALHLRERFNRAWTWESAYKAAEAWHRELAKNSQAEAFFRNHGQDYEAEINLGALPAELQIDGLDFVALRSGLALHEDGRAMHHCVASYAGAVIKGKSRIFSIRRDGKRIATLELVRRKKWQIEQVKGPCNRAPDPAVAFAATRFLGACNDAETASAGVPA